MARESKSTVLKRALQSSMRVGFLRAYKQVQVDPHRYLDHVRRVHRLPIRSWDEMFMLGEEIVTPISNGLVSSSAKAAALEGAGLGLGGMLTLVPDLGILSAITVRMLQKLSLIHGFGYSTEDDAAELWLAAASAAGLDLGRDFIGKQAAERVVPAIVDRVAVKFGTEVAEKWAARIVPLVSAGAGGALNYYFVRAWGRRAQKHFLARHREIASRRALWAHSATVREFSQRGIDPHAVPPKKPRSLPLLDPA
ncbi:MAG: EcsC family protein [Candidatus Acidiferrales bacterium]